MIKFATKNDEDEQHVVISKALLFIKRLNYISEKY